MGTDRLDTTHDHSAGRVRVPLLAWTGVRPSGRSNPQLIGDPAPFGGRVHGQQVLQNVAADPLLRPVYPSRDQGPAEEHLRLFLIQYWGGTQTYSQQGGHPG